MNLTAAQSLNQVVLSLYREGRDVPLRKFQDWALEQVRSLIQFDSAWWGNAATEPMKIHWLHLHNCDKSIIETYPPYIADDFFRAAMAASPGTSINMSNLTTRAQFVRTALYRAIGRRYRIEWSLGTLQIDPISSLSEFLTLWRHDASRPFSETERQTKELLMPHLVEAFRAARLRHFLNVRDTRLNAWALADDQGFIREISPAFAAVLRSHWPEWRSNLLPEALARCVIEGGVYRAKSLTIELKQNDNLRFLEVKARSPLDKLTAHESEIAGRYAKGETYSAISATLTLSPATVRNHISRCFKKLAVNNKAELANLLGNRVGSEGAAN
ncbi:MAG: LuxR C-terminal-related transcriptional regulator [Rhodoferax sp.]